MSKKGAAPGKGPVISKGTPSPPRYKPEEEQPLPTFSITWTAMAVGIELSEEGLLLPRVVELINAATLPHLSLTLVDAQEMAEEEMFVEDSELGLVLKEAKKVFTDQKKDPTKENWIPPELLAQVLAVRSNLDQAFEHRQEEVRRHAALEEAKKASEDAKLAVVAARGQVTAAKEAVKVLIEQERQRVREEKEKKEAEAAAPPPPPPNPKAKPPPAKGKDKGKEPVVPVFNFKTELTRLKQAVTDAEANVKESENRVTTSIETISSLESALLSPYVTGRIYWCLGLGIAPAYIASLAGDAKSIFGALFNVVAKYIIAVKNDAPPSPDPVVLPVQTVPPIITEMKSLIQSSKLFEPARKVAVIDVMYNKVVEPQANTDPKKKPDKKDAKKGGDDSPVLYEEISKALSSSLRKFLEQIKDFEVVNKNSTYVNVPDCIPCKDVDMSYYLKLLSVVPTAMASVPVLMHCMIDQVAAYEKASSTAVESACSTSMESLIKSTLLKTGHEIEGVSLSSLGVPQLQKDLSGPRCSDCHNEKSKTPQDRLIVVHEEDRVGHMVATNLKSKLESTTKWASTSAIDVFEAERKMLQLLPTPGMNRRGMPKKPDLTEKEKGAFATALDAVSNGTFEKTARFRKLKILSDLFLELYSDEEPEEGQDGIDTQVSLRQQVSDRYFVERFPNGLFGDIYSSAKFVLPLEVLKYDEDEDCLLSILYVKDGEHFWQGRVPSQVPFGDFCTVEWASELPRTKHLAYAIERYKGLCLLKETMFFTKGDGLVRCGLPAACALRSAPQITVYKDGNMFLLRKMHSEKGRCFIACLKDGLIIYFFLGEDGSTNLQVTNAAGKTFELSSSGVVLLLPTRDTSLSCSTSNNANEGSEVSPAPEASVVATEQRSSEANDLLSCTSKVVGIMKDEQGELEHWRSVLPSGTTVRYMKNGDSQLLFANGNVSKWNLDVSGDSSWVTTNNKGDTVAKYERKEKPVEPVKEEVVLAPAKKDNKKKNEPVEEPKVEVVEPEKPSVVCLPCKKVVQISDPDTGSSVLTREDLVVIVNSEEDHTRLVQHADGTQIYSTVAMEVPAPTLLCDDDNWPSCSLSFRLPKIDNAEEMGVTTENRQVVPAPEEIAPVTDAPGLAPSENNSFVVAEKTGPKEICRTVAWCVRKEGCPTIHGSEGEIVKVEYSTSGGRYTATWSKIDKQISILLPCGSQLHSKGSSVHFKPTEQFDTEKTATEKEEDESTGINEWESKNFHLGEEPTESAKSINTSGVYIFDLMAGSLCHTDRAGNGFIASKGTKAEVISYGLVVKTEAPTSQEPIPPDAGEGLAADSDDAQNQNTESDGSAEITNSAAPDESVEPNDDASPEAENQMAPAASLAKLKKKPLYAGPHSRLFAIYEGGHGFEILDEDVVTKYKLRKASKQCHYASNKIEGDTEGAIFHMYVTLEDDRAKRSNETASLNCLAFPSGKLNTDSDTDCGEGKGAFDLSQRDFSLPRVISAPKPGPRLDCKVTIAVYRQFLEYPMFQGKDVMKEKNNMAAYVELKNFMSEMPPYLPRATDSPTEADIDEQDEVSLHIKKGRELQSQTLARLFFQIEKCLAEDVIKQVEGVKTRQREEAHKQEQDAIKKWEDDFKKYMESKKKIICMHRATHLLQSEGPYRPLRNMLLLYFKCEEGLRAILANFKGYIFEHDDEDGLPKKLVRVEMENIGAFYGDLRLKVALIPTEEYPKEQVRALDKEELKLVTAKLQTDDLYVRLQLAPTGLGFEDLGPKLVRVKMQGNDKRVTVELLPTGIQLIEGSTGKVRQDNGHVKLKHDWVPREELTSIVYDKEDWVPREDDTEVRVTRFEGRQSKASVLWLENLGNQFRISSTKTVWYPNEKYLEGRETTKPGLRTVSMNLIKRLRPTIDRPQFGIVPEVVDFRSVAVGTVAVQVVTLCNFHPDFSRFKIDSQENCVQVVYDHGPLAAGIGRRLKVHFKGSTPGHFSGKVHIETEFDIFILPVLADVVESS